MERPWNPNKTVCQEVPTWHVGALSIYDPSMLVCAALGLLVGWLGCYLIATDRRTPCSGSKGMYATTMFTFGCMNISGMLIFCFLPKHFQVRDPGSALPNWPTGFTGVCLHYPATQAFGGGGGGGGAELVRLPVTARNPQDSRRGGSHPPTHPF